MTADIVIIEAAKPALCEVCDKPGGDHSFGEAFDCWAKWIQADRLAHGSPT